MVKIKGREIEWKLWKLRFWRSAPADYQNRFEIATYIFNYETEPFITWQLTVSCKILRYVPVKKKVPDRLVVQLARALRHLTLISRK